MVFNSLTFMAFFVIVLALHHLPLSWSVKKFNLLVASYLFYAAWNPPFVLLLLIAAVADFNLARWMSRTESLAGRRTLLTVSLVLNLGVLAYFKYGSFLVANFATLLGSIGVVYQPALPSIILPLGISFYTFETISYLIDVYRRKVTAWDSFLDYALFLTFFPHLVAGPIVRAGDFLPQCRKPHRATADQLGWGFTLLVVGLFEKMVLADTLLSPVADSVFDAPYRAGFLDAWIGTLAFAGQIFFDFAGYSTCAIGVALCFGFVLKKNFHFPYAAVGFADFWQRWHISLSTWLRDYLYIPLGGNRKGTARTYLNLIFTMLLGGLWHGASWRFVAWGGLHGLFLIGERLWGRRRREPEPPRSSWRLLPAMLLTFGLVCLTWVFFRAPDLLAAFHLLSLMLTGVVHSAYHPLVNSANIACVLTVTAGLLATHWMLRDSSLERAAALLPWWLRSMVLAFLITCLVFTPGGDRAFIYFQF